VATPEVYVLSNDLTRSALRPFLVAEVPLPITRPDEEGTSRSGGGYSGPDDKLPHFLVRVDATYLRQDFSIMQHPGDAVPKAARPGRGSSDSAGAVAATVQALGLLGDAVLVPNEQRFDFLVRTRRLTEKEAEGLSKRLKEAGPSPFKKAASEALRKLTGREFGTDAAAWRRYLASRKR
jgi:hypothetical protein